MVTDDMMSFVRQFIEANDPLGAGLIKRFAFRQRAEHCQRVYTWAQRIWEIEGGDRSVVEISALFHDVGKSVDKSHVGHAIKGAKIVKDYLESVFYDPERIRKISDIVENHIYHDNPETLEARIVSDADSLDEIGALTVLWDSMDAGAQQQQSYRFTYERIRGAFQRLRDNPPKMHTPTGRRFYEERMAFLSSFIGNLSYELGFTDSTDTFEVNYDAIAGNYDNHRTASTRVVSLIAGRLRDEMVQNVLEVGCGTANYLLAISAALEANGFGLDRSASMLEESWKKSHNIHLLQADAVKCMPFPEGSFDFVYSVDFIHHIRELPELFAEVFRVLRPGGVVVTVTDSYEDIINRTQSRYFPDTVGIELQRYHPIAALEGELRRAGFVEVELSHTEHTYQLGEGHVAMYRNKAFSMLRLIPNKAFQAGLAQLTADVERGDCHGKELYTFVWARKPK